MIPHGSELKKKVVHKSSNMYQLSIINLSVEMYNVVLILNSFDLFCFCVIKFYIV